MRVEHRSKLKPLIATPLIDGRAEREFINGLISCQSLYHGWACVEGVTLWFAKTPADREINNLAAGVSPAVLV